MFHNSVGRDTRNKHRPRKYLRLKPHGTKGRGTTQPGAALGRRYRLLGGFGALRPHGGQRAGAVPGSQPGLWPGLGHQSEVVTVLHEAELWLDSPPSRYASGKTPKLEGWQQALPSNGQQLAQ